MLSDFALAVLEQDTFLAKLLNDRLEGLPEKELTKASTTAGKGG